jgi:hypothetical protein
MDSDGEVAVGKYIRLVFRFVELDATSVDLSGSLYVLKPPTAPGWNITINAKPPMMMRNRKANSNAPVPWTRSAIIF